MKFQGWLLLGVLACGSAAPAVAEDLEPAVQTSAPAAADGAGPAAARAAPPPASAPAQGTDKAAAAARPGGTRVLDRLELESTQITGNKELPKVMYVVPWRRPDLGEFAGRPPNSLLDELLTPVDRDVFRRQNRYFAALQPDRTGAPSASGDHSTTPAKDEK